MRHFFSKNGSSSSGTGDAPLTEESIDALLGTLFAVLDKRPRRIDAIPDERTLQMIARAATEVFLSQPPLIEVECPVKVCGDIHGQFYDLLRVFDVAGHVPDQVG